ncbi:hypothetical protein C8J57DRAFT_641524 [Mycena rebaudengoi]|nr:hypothetical protein C8J57DRAFT_641524 [Mycena rebaudengoi]
MKVGLLSQFIFLLSLILGQFFSAAIALFAAFTVVTAELEAVCPCLFLHDRTNICFSSGPVLHPPAAATGYIHSRLQQGAGTYTKFIQITGLFCGDAATNPACVDGHVFQCNKSGATCDFGVRYCRILPLDPRSLKTDVACKQDILQNLQ